MSYLTVFANLASMSAKVVLEQTLTLPYSEKLRPPTMSRCQTNPVMLW